MVKLAPPLNWIHDGSVAHVIRRVDFETQTAWCGFTFLPDRPFQQLTRTSTPCPSCHAARTKGNA